MPIWTFALGPMRRSWNAYRRLGAALFKAALYQSEDKPMPLDLTIEDRVRDLNDRYRHQGATPVFSNTRLERFDGGRYRPLCRQFGAESLCVLLHLDLGHWPPDPGDLARYRRFFAVSLRTLAYQAETWPKNAWA